jgi:toxin YoeB
MNKIFTDHAWDDYVYWQSEDKKIINKINELIKDIERNGHSGIGKPEALKHDLSGFYSRRITDEHRLVYSIQEQNINIISCRYHY